MQHGQGGGGIEAVRTGGGGWVIFLRFCADAFYGRLLILNPMMAIILTMQQNTMNVPDS